MIEHIDVLGVWFCRLSRSLMPSYIYIYMYMYMLSRVLAFSSQRIDEQYNSRLVWNIPGGRGILSQGVPHLRYCIQISISGDTLTLVMSVRVPSSFCASSLQKGAKSMIYTYIYIYVYHHVSLEGLNDERKGEKGQGWPTTKLTVCISVWYMM